MILHYSTNFISQYIQTRVVQISGGTSLLRPHFVPRRLIFVGAVYGTYFLSPFQRLECWSASYIFAKMFQLKFLFRQI
jgi:hypothetical protein